MVIIIDSVVYVSNFIFALTQLINGVEGCLFFGILCLVSAVSFF